MYLKGKKVQLNFGHSCLSENFSGRIELYLALNQQGTLLS